MYVYRDKRGRWLACYNKSEGKHTTRSYPRLIMEEKLGRKLLPNEDVHHIDENPDNNDPSNLTIKLKGPHQYEHMKDKIKYRDKFMVCPQCGITFIWKKRKQQDYYANLKRPGRANMGGPFCSKHCAGKYSTDKQYHRI